MTRWLDIVGMSEQGLSGLDARARGLLEEAQTIIGVARRLEGLAAPGRQLVEWNGSLDEMVTRILAARRTPTVLLASGDPNWFGIGATLSRHLAPEEFAMHPVPSSFQLAAARMHWPMQGLSTLSLHGRPVAALQPHILPGNRILALTSDATTLPAVAKLLRARNYGASRLTVLENLGGQRERRIDLNVEEALSARIGDFYVLAIDAIPDQGAQLLPMVPGLPDEAFVSDGQMTKRDVRATTLAKLAPFPGALLWDVGAGCGSIGIEWMRAARDAQAICFEREGRRIQMIGVNRDQLGVPGLTIIGGQAPDSFADQAPPDAIFLGGDVANELLFAACWSALKPGGSLVANAVTLDGEQALVARQKQHGGELCRIDISVLDVIGAQTVMRPRMMVTQWHVCKGADQ